MYIAKKTKVSREWAQTRDWLQHLSLVIAAENGDRVLTGTSKC